jgi:hypothetical protein
MLDLGHLYNTSNRSIQYFSTPGSWVTWNKPRYCSFIRILCIGAGGGGGQGGAILSSYATGGGGGGSGAMTYVIIPANFLPDILYVFCALGSTLAGEASYVSVAPNNSGIYTVCAANGGGYGDGGPAGNSYAAGGSGGSASSASSLILGSVYAFTYAGQAGGGASAGQVGEDLNYPTTGLLLSGGGGGGGYYSGVGFGAQRGGYIYSPTSQTSVYNIFQTITNGSSGIELYKPLLSTGGSGGGLGGSSNGGAGGFGSGGGGARYETFTNSRGGNGLVIIQTW